ncbi:CusA/CzcA family heavy metal efflux RND transporter [Acetobacter sp. LMG 1636]|uniref:CusA/CzcA family heavy metal efflux RND transporter n=2 Tax=Acetobacter fallax TaxID=1737473 RepID=A0ABX0K8A0_9PROT|nr:CusA/CzcA family heavy metal efflux RND transporter [Acetobacter fallax]NHO32620.1 CusA/CzcA family heavy metal efflux RND transporter [Acetobacter fallax]NHO36182.1 CusA/CzcA family heavy metal efflux RND transporter [Acetobacter fallax]
MRRFLLALQGSRFVLLALLAGLLIVGVGALFGLPVEAVPDISPRQVLVSVVAPGLATEEVEKLITFPVESAMTGLPSLVDLRSVSRSGVSVVYVQFSDDTDIDQDRTWVNQRLDILRGVLTMPNVSTLMGPRSTGMGEIMQFRLEGDGYSPMDLNRIMTWDIVPQLRLIPGVTDVNVNGGAEETWQVAMSNARLVAYGLSTGDVYRAVDAGNAVSGGGWIEHHAGQQIVVGRGLVRSLADFGAIPVKTSGDGIVIRVRDLGPVSAGPRTRLGAVTRDGLGETVVGVVMMQQGASSDATLAAIRARLPAVRQSLPAGVRLVPFYERSTLTNMTLDTVRENLILGALLVIAVLIVVIGDWRASLVIASSIPFALICAMTGMRVFGISANLLSLGAIDFGMIVDSSLVVIEHVLARRAGERDVPLTELVVSSLEQVIRPVSFAILVIIMVYLPVLTLQGIEGKMFRPMAQTVIMALVASLVWCVVFIPVIAAMVLRGSPVPVMAEGAHHETRLMVWLRRRYEPMVAWGERHSTVMFASALGIFLVSVFLATRLGGEFIPRLDEGTLTVTTTRLPAASLTTVLEGVTRQERILRSFPEVTSVVTTTGTSAIPTDPMGVNESDSFIFLKEPSGWVTAKTQDGLVEAMSRKLREDLPDTLQNWSQPVEMRMDDLLSGVRSQIAVSVYGDDLAELSRLARQVSDTIAAIPGAADVAPQDDGQVSFIHVDPDRDRAARLDVSVSDILDTVEAVGGHIGKPVTVGNAIIPTQVRFSAADSASVDRIGQLRVRRADGRGSVPLSSVAHVVVEDGPPRISRDGIRRRVIVQANVRGRDLGSFVTEAEKRVTKSVVLPHGYRMEWAGQFRNLQSAMARLEIVVPIALALIYVLLVAALGSAAAAALVFLNLPMAATGGIFLLWARGLPFSISAGIGFIALFGVAILNGVVLVSAISVLRRRDGLDAATAAFRAAEERFRPVMATALVASLGFFPMAFSGSAGAEVERPLATVVIGGLVSSTLLTLLVLPSLYARVMRNRV